MKKIIIALVIIILIGAGVYFFTRPSSTEVAVIPNTPQTSTTTQPTSTATTTTNLGQTVIGTSVEGRTITAYHYGDGDTEILFVGGIHGGYSWNTAAVAYEAMDYFSNNEDRIPENVSVTVIPVLNPDGLNKVVRLDANNRFDVGNVSTSESTLTSGRFNGNNVDLNRNFDCDWKAEGTWQNRTVDGGEAAFSEPESKAIKSYIEARDPEAVVVWYSSASGVFASSCHNGVLPETRELTNAFAKASGYKAFEEFDFYEITGDMVNWLAKIGTPAISILLTDHTSTEWTKNQKGIEALLDYYAN